MKIAPRQIASFLTKPPAEITAVLVHGTGLGMASERANKGAQVVSGSLAAEFAVARLTGDMQ